MKEVKAFEELKQEELEIPKNECAIYLDLYYRFIEELLKNPKDSYINIFKKVRYKDNNIKLNVVNETSCYSEYDYMIQFAQFFTINKFFSILVDNNIDYIEQSVSNEYFDDKYYMNNSNRFTKKNLIKLLRNAFNHNDKNEFQLFRLIKSKSDIDLYLEIFLRKPNMHLKIKVKDLFDIFRDILNARSIYDYQFKDKNGDVIESSDDLKKGLDNKMILELIHYYNFDLPDNISNDKVINRITGNSQENIIKSFELDTNQKHATKNTLSKITNKHKRDCTFALRYILRDNIPFGMTKIYGYGYDINYFFKDLYNPKNSYYNYINELNARNFQNQIEEAEVFYYSIINSESMIDRSFSLFASYILDSVIVDSDFKLNGQNINKNYYRNSFVHGRWYSYDDASNNRSLVLKDYEHGDENIMSPSSTQDLEKIISQKDLYTSLKTSITKVDYDLPLSFIIDNSDDGYHITYRVNGINYYCNMSITNKAPIFLLIGEKNNEIFIASGEDFNLFKKEIEKINPNDFDSRIFNFIKKMPKIVQKSLKTLLNTTSDEEYKESLKQEINELLDICIDIKLGINSDQTILHFHHY